MKLLRLLGCSGGLVFNFRGQLVGIIKGKFDGKYNTAIKLSAIDAHINTDDNVTRNEHKKPEVGELNEETSHWVYWAIVIGGICIGGICIGGICWSALCIIKYASRGQTIAPK